MKAPAIEEFGDGFRVIFYRKVINEAQKIGSDFSEYEEMLLSAGITKTFITNINMIYRHMGQGIFKQSDVMNCLDCSKAKAGNLMSAMRNAGIIEKVTGMGPGRYRFVSEYPADQSRPR